MVNVVKRIKLFKVPKEDDIDRILAQFEILRKTARKVWKLTKYILLRVILMYSSGWQTIYHLQ